MICPKCKESNSKPGFEPNVQMLQCSPAPVLFSDLTCMPLDSSLSPSIHYHPLYSADSYNSLMTQYKHPFLSVRSPCSVSYLPILHIIILLNIYLLCYAVSSMRTGNISALLIATPSLLSIYLTDSRCSLSIF